jgi:hypothetical protein
MCLLHRVCIFQLYLEFVWRNSIFLVKSLLIYDWRSILKCSHGTFVTFIEENGVLRGKLQLLGFFHYNFWHKSWFWMKLAPALVPLEAWFWYMLFLDLLSAKLCLGFLTELIEQILHTIKFGEILWSQAVYT